MIQKPNQFLELGRIGNQHDWSRPSLSSWMFFNLGKRKQAVDREKKEYKLQATDEESASLFPPSISSKNLV